MLNDLFIARDVVGYLKQYTHAIGLESPAFAMKLEHFSARQFMSYEQWWRLLDELEALTGSECLGIEIGQNIKAEHVGVLGYLFRTSENIGEALDCFLRFQRLIYAGSLAQLHHHNGQTSIIWEPEDGYSTQTSDEILLSAIVNIVRLLTPPQTLKLTGVGFTQAMTKQRINACQAFFECPVMCNQEKLSITFDASSLSLPILHSDSTLHRILGQQAEELVKQLPDTDTFLAEIRDCILRNLSKGSVDAGWVAAHLHMSERSLHRRLKQKNRLFRHILSDIRKSLALNYMRDPKLTLSETALLLGYSEQSSFTRAFTQWFGTSPNKYLKSHKPVN